MIRLMFVVPVHGRLELTKICLRQLARTCASLIDEGMAASAIVVTSKEELRKLRATINKAGFGYVVRDNEFLGRRFNDGIQLATDPAYNPHPADFVVPCGSDDWVDHRLFLDPLPASDTIMGFKRMAFVREDGREMVTVNLGNRGGAGIRIIPRQLIEPLGYRPAAEDRKRACDTSILSNLYLEHGGALRVHDSLHLHDYQIVDWKSPGAQLNTYGDVTTVHRPGEQRDPYIELADFYPAEALEEMRQHYARKS